jgi:hypothetical protein
LTPESLLALQNRVSAATKDCLRIRHEPGAPVMMRFELPADDVAMIGYALGLLSGAMIVWATRSPAALKKTAATLAKVKRPAKKAAQRKSPR